MLSKKTFDTPIPQQLGEHDGVKLTGVAVMDQEPFRLNYIILDTAGVEITRVMWTLAEANHNPITESVDELRTRMRQEALEQLAG